VPSEAPLLRRLYEAVSSVLRKKKREETDEQGPLVNVSCV